MSISFQAVSKWENGETLPDTSLLLELADILDTTVDKLLNGGVIVMKNKNVIHVEDVVSGFNAIKEVRRCFGDKSLFYQGMIDGINDKMNMDLETYLEKFEMLKEIIRGDVNVEMTVEQAELIDFLDTQINAIDTKAEKAKARNAEKKANGDELRDAVQSILTDELQTIDAIVAQIEGEEVTKAKITARLTSLVKNGIATKEEVKDEEGRKLKAYKLVA